MFTRGRSEQQQILIDSEPDVIYTEQVTENHNDQQPKAVENDQEVQVPEELAFVDEEQLNLQLSKQREFDRNKLHRLLLNELELEARAKAKEEVSKRTLETQLQEVLESQRRVTQEIAYEEAISKQLQQEEEVEKVRRLLLGKEMENCSKMIEHLKHRCDNLEKVYDIEAKEVQKLDCEQEALAKHYETRKADLLEAMRAKNQMISELNEAFVEMRAAYNSQINLKNDHLKELNQSELSVREEILDIKVKCAHLDTELVKNNETLTELVSQNTTLQNLINHIDLEKMEKEKQEKDESYKKALDELQNEIVQTKEGLNKGELREETLQKDLQNKINYTNELEAKDAELEDELVNLLSKKKELQDAHEALNGETHVILNLLQSELQENIESLNQLNQQAEKATQDKDEKNNDLQNTQKEKLELESKIDNLQSEKKKLADDVESNTLKLVQLEKIGSNLEDKLKNVTTALGREETVYLRTKSLMDQQLSELNKKLQHEQNELEKIKKDSASHLKNLQNELEAYTTQTEKANTENQEKNQQVLQELHNELLNTEYEIKKENEQLEPVKKAIEEAEIKLNQLQLNVKCLPQNTLPSSILKSPGKASISKNVSWRCPSNSTIDSNPPNSIVEQERITWTTEELFQELFRSSPPERLEKAELGSEHKKKRGSKD